MTTISEIYGLINDFRSNPEKYNPSCGYGNLRLPSYQVNKKLEEAAEWQARNLCGPVSHTTCPEHCHLFNNSCRHIERIKSFILPNQSWNEHELIVQGPRHPFPHLVQSQGHCQLLLANNLNSIGGYILGHLLILVLVWLN